MPDENSKRVPSHSAQADRPTLKLEEFLPYRLNVCASLVSQALSRIYAERYKIGVPEWRVLVTLGEFGMMTAKAIGMHSHMHKTKVSRAVALLERRKLVTRAGQPRRSARGIPVADPGRPRHLRRSSRRSRSISPASCWRRVDAADRAALDRALDKLTERSAQLAPDIANGARRRIDCAHRCQAGSHSVKLYSYFRSSAAYRVRIALNLKGLPYEMDSVHLTKDGGQQRKPEFAPSIRRCACRRSSSSSGEVLTQSLAIIEYLDEIHPRAAAAAGRRARARQGARRSRRSIACDIHPLNNLSAAAIPQAQAQA